MKRVILLGLISLATAGEANLKGSDVTPISTHRVEKSARETTMLVSWYGSQFHGRKTANGEVFDMRKVSAAHRTLPFGTIVELKNPKNGKELHVRVNDRGPYVYDRRHKKWRDLDLSWWAAVKLGIAHSGVAELSATILLPR